MIRARRVVRNSRISFTNRPSDAATRHATTRSHRRERLAVPLSTSPPYVRGTPARWSSCLRRRPPPTHRAVSTVRGRPVRVAGGAGGGRARVLHRHVRRRGGQRRAAVDPDRSRRRDHRAAVGGRRLHVDVRRAAARRGALQRSPRGPPGVRRRRRRVRRRVGGVRSRPGARRAGRGPLRAGLGRGGDDAGVDGPDRPGLPRARSSGHGPSRSGRWAAPSRRRRRPVLGGLLTVVVVAADLPHQHPRRRRRGRPRRSSRPVAAPRRRRSTRSDSPPQWWRWAGSTFGAIEAGEHGFTAPSCSTAFAVAGLVVRRVRRPATTRAASDGAARAVPTPQRHRQPSPSGSRSSSATTGCRS